MKSSVLGIFWITSVLCGCDQPPSEGVHQAVTAFNLGRYDSTIVYCDRALPKDPKNCHLWELKGRALAVLEKRPQAIEAFDRALAIDPHCPHVREYRGISYKQSGDTVHALEDLVIAVASDPTNNGLRLIYANLLTSTKRYTGALAQYDTLLHREPWNARYLKYKAVSLRRSGDPQTALKLLDESLALDSSDGFAYDERGHCLVALERPGEAIEAFTKAIDRYTSEKNLKLKAFSLNNRGYAKYKNGDLDAALKDMDWSEHMKPDNAYVHRNKALVFLQQGNRTRACEELHTASTMGTTPQYGGEVLELIKQNCH